MDREIKNQKTSGLLVGILTPGDAACALQLATDTDFGLSSAVFTRGTERGARFGLGIRTGMTHVNDMPVNDEARVPFGGRNRVEDDLGPSMRCDPFMNDSPSGCQ